MVSQVELLRRVDSLAASSGEGAVGGRMETSPFPVRADGRVAFECKDFRSNSDFSVEVDCPIVNRLHERQEELAELHLAWARHHTLLRDESAFARFAATRFDTLIGYQYYGWPLQAAAVASHLMTWFFVFDDCMDMDHDLDDATRRHTLELAHRHLQLLEGSRVSDRDPVIAVAFADFLSQVRRLTDWRRARWYDRLVHHLKEYVHGTLWESALGATTAARANTAMYLQVRHLAVGVAPCLDLMAITKDVDPAQVDANPFVQRLERMTINYSIWINDLAGLNRDQSRNLSNVIFTMQKDHGLSLQAAAQMVGRQCDGELNAFFQLERQLPLLLGNAWEDRRAALEGYREVLRRWMRGLLDWSAKSARYRRLSEDMSLQTEATIRAAALAAVEPRRPRSPD